MHKSATKAFYLAVFALFAGHCGVEAAPWAELNPDICALDPRAKVTDACASYVELDFLNSQLHPYVRKLANNTDFFSYYRLNLYNKKCPFWSDESGLCGNIACAVTTLENEQDIPAIWRAEELSKLEGPKAEHPGKRQQRELERPLQGNLGADVDESCVVEYDDECDDRDYCVPDDERVSSKGDYVSLSDNPERFTGYAGEGAHQVWEAIYRENCFSRPSGGDDLSSPGLSSPLSGLSENRAQASFDFKQVMRAHEQEARESGSQEEGLEFEDECLEKRVFYRVISGMHASISTHLCYEYLNQTTGEWSPNLECYKERLHKHPERISNLYFNYAFVLRAVGKLRDYLQDYTFCTGDAQENHKTRVMLDMLGRAIPAGSRIFDESIMFQDQTTNGISLKEDFRNRFRNVSRIMDCVGCDKCRLWGKLQTAGFGAALKVLFEFGNEGAGEGKATLRRTEIVALINTLDKISSALKRIEDFRTMMGNEIETEKQTLPESNEPPAQKSQPVDSKDLNELNDLHGHEPIEPRSLSDDFWAEIDVVSRAVRYVLKSWWGLPKKTFQILLLEMERLWDFWLGRDVKARTWEIGLPSREDFFRDEL